MLYFKLDSKLEVTQIASSICVNTARAAIAKAKGEK